MATNPDFEDLFSALNAADARYLVVGAYAVIHHTEPRYTKDLDVWVDPDTDNASRVWRALTTFGAPLEDVSLADLQDPEMVYQIGIEPNRIDILMGIRGVDFATAYGRADPVTYGGVPIRLLGLGDLIVAKRAAGRPQDLIDLERLERARARKERR